MCFIDNMAIKQLHLGKTSVVKHWAKKKKNPIWFLTYDFCRQLSLSLICLLSTISLSINLTLKGNFNVL